MNALARHIETELGMLDAAHELPDGLCDPPGKLLCTVTVCCRALEHFLRIHPYANGNGHAARFLVWAILWRYGYWTRRWPLDGSPPYHALLSRYRDGDVEPLEKFLLACV